MYKASMLQHKLFDTACFTILSLLMIIFNGKQKLSGGFTEAEEDGWVAERI